ncbi:MAG TPA: enoyl-CoA hydratase/isomerase family protein [Amycolatopsis sp.]|nr:enoyl-CoA hydratase/isomerase family protein [Amycolatopsis sp.]
MGNVVSRVEKGVAEIQLTRPEALNSLNFPMLDELDAALDSVGQDKSVNAVVLSGAGRAFCTGADLKSVISLFDEWPRYVEFLYRLTDVFRKLEDLPVPTIARVHGYALAGGLELILCCDVAIAAENALIGDQHANVGLIAGAGGIPRLVRRIGKQQALSLLYTGARVSGTRAEHMGIVLRAVPETELDSAVCELTENLVNKSRTSLSYMKRVVAAGTDVPLVTALNEERAALLEYFSTSSSPREGISAFLEEREPNFDE